MAKTKGYHKRKGGRRPNRERKRKLIIHIICEGQNTEPDYFKEFPLTNAKVITVGKGEQHTKLVKSAISYKSCLLYTSPSPRDATLSRMPSSA